MTMTTPCWGGAGGWGLGLGQAAEPIFSRLAFIHGKVLDDVTVRVLRDSDRHFYCSAQGNCYLAGL
jgi:hypothetical protein